MVAIGDVLKQRYRVDSFVGRGGMADVYLVFDLRRQTHLALKVLREDLAEDPEFVRRFRREAEALARLDHPNVVRFYAFEVDGSQAFIVMDYVPGSTLRRRLSDAKGPFAMEEITHILRQVGAALQYAHNEGYVHRDVKPANIMLRDDGVALLSDFGVVRAAETTTMTMGPIGTPAYMSPEQFLGEEVDPRTDIYSLGVVLFEVVTGRRPFTGDQGTGTSTIDRVRYGHLHTPPPDPRSINEAIAPALNTVILRALEKRPEARWPDVQSLVRAWESALGIEPSSALGGRAGARSRMPSAPLAVQAEILGASTPGLRSADQPTPSPKRTWLAVGGVMVTAVLTLSVLRMFLVAPPPATPPPTLTLVVLSDTPIPSVTPNLDATAQRLAKGYIAVTSQVETAIAAAANGTIDAAARAASSADAATARARQSTATVQAAGTRAAETALAATEKTRAAAEAEQLAAYAAMTRSAAAAQSTREALSRATEAVRVRLTDSAQATSVSVRATENARPKERCFRAQRRHWEKTGGGAGEIGGIVYDINRRPFAGATIHLYIKGGNWDQRVQVAKDGGYGFCCLAYSLSNIHVVELIGANIRTIEDYTFYINNLDLNRVLVDFYEISCP